LAAVHETVWCRIRQIELDISATVGYSRTVNVEFECIVCGERAVASVDEDELPDDDEPMETLHDCPTCGIETIWVAT